MYLVFQDIRIQEMLILTVKFSFNPFLWISIYLENIDKRNRRKKKTKYVTVIQENLTHQILQNPTFFQTGYSRFD